jgi:alginate O-acetyltransferase complex protein AlgJ
MSTEKLTAAQVRTVYEVILGRDIDEADVEIQLGQPDLAAMMRMALESAEYAERLRLKAAVEKGPGVVNIYHPDLADYTLRPGTYSDDEIAIVGHDGYLFLFRGTNSNLDQHLGAAEPAAGWLDEWRDIVISRLAEFEAMELTAVNLVVPDKLAVCEDRYPMPLEKVGPRPIKRLLAVPELARELIYPIEDLRQAYTEEEVYLRTDTHLTFRGNEVLFRSLIEPLGIDQATVPDFAAMPLRSYANVGDLGAKFEPRIVDIVSVPKELGAAEISRDNCAQLEAVGGHVGIHRVFRNETAPDPRIAVLYGDSFAFSSSSYQGVSWFMAQIFREVHFVWVPFGWDPAYVREVGAEVVLVQGAERFLGRSPHRSFEVAGLAEETLRRKTPIVAESFFD